MSWTAVALASAVGMLLPAAANASPLNSAPEFWSPHGNESLLLTATDVAGITRARGLHVADVSAVFADDSKRVEPVECVVAYQPAERPTYPDAINATTVVMHDSTWGLPAGRLVQQSIVGFRDASAARQAFDAASAAWTRCGARTVTVEGRSGRPAPWLMGAPTHRGDGAVLAAANRGPEVNCERAMALRKEDIVDVRVCALGNGDTAGQAEAIAAVVSGDRALKRTR
jgi:PknH-like extracellular domain